MTSKDADNTDRIKLKNPPSETRPVYYCQQCDKSFGSQLDLDQHIKIDHSRSVAA